MSDEPNKLPGWIKPGPGVILHSADYLPRAATKEELIGLTNGTLVIKDGEVVPAS